MVGVLCYFVPYYLPVWWYLANRQLHRLGRSEAHAPYGRFPVLSLAAFTGLARSFVVPTLISLYRGRLRLHAAQREAGITRPNPATTAKSLVALFLCGYVLLQSPLQNLSVLLGSNRLQIPVLDANFLGYGLLGAIVRLAIQLAVLALVAAYFQRGLSACLSARHEAVPEGIQARPICPERE
jgi:hypothetical protein